jgi:hypothetical protein
MAAPDACAQRSTHTTTESSIKAIMEDRIE